jgi:hypothetical protein
LPLPWATYIDKKIFPIDDLKSVKSRIAGQRSLAADHGYELNVHSVCQQIHWRRYIAHYQDMGVSDLHISHYETTVSPARDGFEFRVHSWPLIAPNVENKDMSDGLIVGKPITDKKYLASFIGAHMKHYPSDVRLKLMEAAKKDAGSDLLIEVNDEWHFNKIVYQEQVQNKKLSDDVIEDKKASTKRYNELISDSIFSICPEGAGPNTLRVWESLAVGSIPVIIADNWIPPKVDGDSLSAAIFIKSQSIGGIFDELRKITPSEILLKQKLCIDAYSKYRKLTCWS